MAIIWEETLKKGLFDARQLLGADGVQRFDIRGNFSIAGVQDTNGTRYSLLTPLEKLVRVNGHLVVGGLRVLDHKDEIFAGAKRYYFSSESDPELVVYRHDGEARTLRCPVCRGPINNGDQVVVCPGCKRVYHQIEASESQSERPCWDYAPSCNFCEHPTSLTGETTWRPEKEGL